MEQTAVQCVNCLTSYTPLPAEEHDLRHEPELACRNCDHTQPRCRRCGSDGHSTCQHVPTAR